MNSRGPFAGGQRRRRAAVRSLGRLALTGALAALAVAGCSGGAAAPAHRPPAAPTPGQEARLDDPARAWVDETLGSLTLREKAAQTVIRWISGGYVSTESDAFDTLTELVDRGVGGVSISVGLPHSYVAKLNALQARAEVPLLVASDFESGGPGMRMGGVYAIPSLLTMGGGTQMPPTMGFGAIGEERFARELGRITGREARAVGVHLTFAPVVDVNSDPANPIVNTRSFGEDPGLVGRLGAAFVRGAREEGLLTTAKHFPGHGDTETDSHLEMPSVDADSARLDTLELAPFRDVVRAGVDAVMTAHVAVPGVEGPGAPPATFSPYFLREVLRERMGFRGLVVTDALTMDAITASHTDGEAAVRALRAGADVLLSPADVGEAVDAVVSAVREGRLARSALDASVRRVLEAKARAGLHRGRRTDLEGVDRVVGRREHRAFADTAAVRSITLARDRAGLVPLDTSRISRVLAVTLARQRDPVAGRAFDRTLAAAGIAVERVRVLPSTGAAEYDSLAARAADADAALLSVYLPPEAGAGSVALPPAFAAFAERLLAGSADGDRGAPSAGQAGSTPSVALVSFGNPYLLSAVPEAPTYLVAWGDRPVSQRAAARALTGAAPVTGRLPVTIPPHHTRGEGLWRGPVPRRVEGGVPSSFGDGWWRGGLAERPPGGAGVPELAAVDSVIRAAVADSVTPGAALAVGHRGRWLRLRGYGRTDWGPDAPAVTDSTLYDLASLTKAVGTATALARLAAAEGVRTDHPVSRWLSGWKGTSKDSVTVGDLLRHRSGLPAHRPWWTERAGRDAYREALREVEPIRPPGDSTVYSDLGFLALGLLVEQVTDEPLDRHLRRTVFGPLGMDDTGFRPVRTGPGDDRPTVGAAAVPLQRVAPTEVDTVFRDRHVHGEVHDENAWAMGGVAGHAGLFSSARDLAVFAQTLLNRGWGAPRAPVSDGYRLVRVLDPRTLERFTSAGPEGKRGLGWDVARSEDPFAPGAFGHTGFTGTSLWVDPTRELFVVLLTNRVNPTRAESRHGDLRRSVHRAVVEAVDAAGQADGEGAGTGVAEPAGGRDGARPR